MCLLVGKELTSIVICIPGSLGCTMIHSSRISYYMVPSYMTGLAVTSLHCYNSVRAQYITELVNSDPRSSPCVERKGEGECRTGCLALPLYH